MFGETPVETPAEVDSKPQFSPTAADVSACLLCKSTVDLAAESMPGHTQVLMCLAGVWQPVWVPLGKDQAVAAGLKLYDPHAAASDPAQVEGTADKRGATPEGTRQANTGNKTPAAETPAAETTETPDSKAQQSTQSAPAGTPKSSQDGQASGADSAPAGTPKSSEDEHKKEPTGKASDADAKAAVKNGYMRFFRSVTSEKCPPEIAEKWKATKAKGEKPSPKAKAETKPEKKEKKEKKPPKAKTPEQEAKNVLWLHLFISVINAKVASGTDGEALRPFTEALTVAVAGYKGAASTVRSLLPKAKAKAKAQSKAE
eukprot:s614_g16.t1